MTFDRRWVQRSDDFDQHNFSTDSIVMQVNWVEHLVFSMLADFFQLPDAVVGGKGNSSACVSAKDCAKRADIACVAGQCVKYVLAVQENSR